MLGTPSADGPGLPGGNSLWRRPQVRSQDAWGQAVALADALGRAGVFSQFLYDTPQGGSWPESLSAFPAILVPELAVLDEARTEQLRQYVKKGGRLIAFGHASMLDATGQPARDYALGDVLTQNLSRVGTLIVLVSSLIVGILFATQGWILTLPALFRRVGHASSQAVARARVSASAVSGTVAAVR